MSFLVNILRCILCCDEDEEEIQRRNRNRNRNNGYGLYNRREFPTYDAYRTSNAALDSTSIYDCLLRKSEGTAHHHHGTTQIHSSNSYSHPRKLPEKPITRKLPAETRTSPPVKPKPTLDSGVERNGSSVSVKPGSARIATHEISQKPKILPPPPANLGTIPNKTSDKTLPQELSSSSSSQPPPSSYKLVPSCLEPLPFSSKLYFPSPKPVSSPSSSCSHGTPPSSPKRSRPSTKPTLSLAPPNPSNPQGKTSYVWVQKGTTPIYAIPEDLKELFRKDLVPGVLKKPLSPSTYKDYFGALLHAEDFYIEKWDEFEMKDVTLALHEASLYKRKGKYNIGNVKEEEEVKLFVAFEIDSVPERRPFLLSRDFVFVRPSRNAEPFQGLIYRVVKSNLVLADFGEDFHSWHYSACKYDVKFSFNRVCLKRAHQAISAASDPLFRNFLFPDCLPKNRLVAARHQTISPKLDPKQASAVRQISSHQSPPPYLVEGPLCVNGAKQLSRTGLVVCEAVLHIWRTSPSSRILICAPTNKTCDIVTSNLRKEIPESDIFRANAAFREFDGVPFDILPTCLYERECFSCPSLQELRRFKVILSTFMSSFRLHNEGIMAGHFSHIFLLDASSVTEPETMVALANLVNESTAVTITGAPGNRSGWVRSNIARKNGLLISYFERLRESKLHKALDSRVITLL